MLFARMFHGGGGGGGGGKPVLIQQILIISIEAYIVHVKWHLTFTQSRSEFTYKGFQL